MSSPPPASPIVAPLEAPPARGGCLRVALIGCGGLALLCVLAFVGFVLYSKKNPGLFLDIATRQIENNYGPDVTEQDKQDLHAALADLKEAIRTDRIRRDRNSGWSRSFNFRGSRSDKLSHDDVRDIIRSFREAILPPPSATPSTAPATVPTPS
jgi:hypothetical protein